MTDKRSTNLCSVYMLPLLGLNRGSFGETNFINSFVNEEDSHIVVQLRFLTTLVNNHNAFRFHFKEGDKLYAIFEVPDQFRDTVSLFRAGKYSQFSDEAKTMIRRKSGLRYRAPQPDGRVISARELLVLDKDKGLKKAIEKELSNYPKSPVVLDDDAELASIPGEDNFFALNLNKPIELSVK